MFGWLFKNFICCIHFGRAGSTVVGQVLNQSPEALVYSEIFHDMAHEQKLEVRRFKKIFLFRVLFKMRWRQWKKKKKFVYFEIKAIGSQLGKVLGWSPQEVMTVLHNFGIQKFVFLERKNTLRMFVSYKVSLKAGTWHERVEEEKKFRTVKLFEKPSDDILRFVQENVDRAAGVRKFLEEKEGAFDQLQLVYERDIEKDPLVAVKKICDFSGIPFAKHFKVTLRKVNTYTLEETIEDFDLVKEALGGTEHAWMLEV